MNDFIFAEPRWLHALWGVLALLVVLFLLERRRGAALGRLLEPIMQARLVVLPSGARRTLRLICFGLCAASLVVALMRPQWGLTYERSPRSGCELMVCLDVSKSMLAEDVAPNRLERAASEIEDLLDYLEGDHVGLIAFAGSATVLSPLTPDFGFLKLALRGAGPQSVTRGGTRISEPIQKAVAGFGDAGDVSRAVLLITDGEDHDSYPVEAAKRAAERGVRIFSIGLGDEAGSEVVITDPKTGARTAHVDSEGTPVRTRMVREVLEQIASETGGKFIPAGTRALDLQSIYQEILAPLTRGQLDDRGRPVRNEGFQWALLAALAFLVTGVAATSGRAVAPRLQRAGALCVLLSLLLTGTAAHAQEAPPAESETPPAPEITDPREIYNRALDLLEAGSLDEAEQKFRDARTRAGDDGTARYSATYNLAFVEVARADAALEANPKEALARLHAAADWFREAAQLRPSEQDPRHNLEIILRRALALEDSLAAKESGDLAERLDKLIQTQRAQGMRIQELVEQQAAAKDAPDPEALRPQFRALDVEQRKQLAEADKLAEDGARERDGITTKKEQEQTPDEKVRAAQLSALLEYLHPARERMGQSRQQLRQKRGERAYRRSAEALRMLKRARDQLRDPVAVLGAIISDGDELLRNTGLLFSASAGLAASAESGAAPPTPPAWLTPGLLEEAQRDAEQRTFELHTRLNAGLAHLDAQKEAEQADPEPIEPETEKFFELVRAALPHLQAGLDAYKQATTSLAAEQLAPAFDQQRRGLGELIAAREYFLDVRGLIETIYRSQAQIAGVLASEESEVREHLAEFIPTLGAAEEKDLARSARLDGMLAEEEAKGAATPGDAEAAAQVEQERQRTQLARKILKDASAQIEVARQLFAEAESAAPEALAAQIERVRPASELARARIEELRRLYFSLVEHLQDTARREAALLDETVDTAAISDEAARQSKCGPLPVRQAELAAITGEIHKVLEEQAAQPPQQQAAQGGQEAQQKLQRAAELVGAAGAEMSAATGHLKSTPPDFDAAPKSMENALEQLLEAIALLQPPKQQEQDQQQQQQQEQQEQGEQQPQEGEQKDEQAVDPAQLLQGVRDREAKRAEEKAKRKAGAGDAHGKDW